MRESFPTPKGWKENDGSTDNNSIEDTTQNKSSKTQKGGRVCNDSTNGFSIDIMQNRGHCISRCRGHPCDALICH